jgi:hypothetical protein
MARALGLFVIGVSLAGGRLACAQATTRLILSNGTGVPGHSGFVFGPFSNLTMNEAKDIVFLTSLRSARIDLRAVVRSTGVTFSVVAFQGLRSPIPRATYDSFSSPSMNAGGDIVFTAQLKDEVPTSAVIRVKGGSASAVAMSGDTVPGLLETTFQDFSAPLVNSAGNVLFGARTGGKTPGSGLFLWTRRGIQTVAIPPTLKLLPADLLEPAYFSHDEAGFVPRGTAPDAAVDQFFRALAVKSFQELNPPPELSQTFELLPARTGEAPVSMLLALMEGDSVQTVPLIGDPSQAVMARRQGGAALKHLGRVLGQTVGAREQLLFAASTAEQENDLAVYCYCDGQVTRLTSVEEYLPILQGVRGRPILGLSGDLQQTIAFIVPGGQGADSTAIYVTSLP